VQRSEDAEYAPRVLQVTPDTATVTIHKAEVPAEPVQLTYPVNVVLREGQDFYVCNYARLFLVSLDRQAAWEIARPAGLKTAWVPTALAYDAASRKLYVATYTGGTVVVVDAAERTRVKLAAVIAHQDMKGPEGVALSEDGRHVAVADYDGHGALLFTAAGKLRWRQPVPSCHGIACTRGQDGQPCIVATSLGESALCQFDFQGKLLRKIANPSWRARDSYLYPTAVVARRGGTTAVTDAFRGQVAFLDADLTMTDVLGGNGPGPGLFNNPYACCWDAGGERLLVADTFKDRLVEVDRRRRAVTRIFRLTDGRAPAASFVPPRFERGCEVAALGPTTPPAPTLANVRPFGDGYEGEVDQETAVTLPLPHFGAAVGPRLGTAWHPRINGLVSASASPAVAWSLGLSGLFTDYPYRFIRAGNYDHEGHTYLLLTSPQCADVLVCGRGVTAPLPLRKDTWLFGDTLIGEDYAVEARRVVRLGAQRIAGYLSQLPGQEPLAAIRSTLFPKMKQQQFLAAFAAAMVSPEGKDFARTCLQAAGADGQRAAAQQYLQACKDKDTFYLPEVFLAEMVLAKSGS
jgi:hypothetical protein